MVVGKFSFPDRNIDHLADPCMGQVMKILWNNKYLRKKILQEFELIPENDITLLVNYLKDLREIMENKLTTTAEQDKIHERILRKSWLRKSNMDEKVEGAYTFECVAENYYNSYYYSRIQSPHRATKRKPWEYVKRQK